MRQLRRWIQAKACDLLSSVACRRSSCKQDCDDCNGSRSYAYSATDSRAGINEQGRKGQRSGEQHDGGNEPGPSHPAEMPGISYDFLPEEAWRVLVQLLPLGDGI